MIRIVDRWSLDPPLVVSILGLSIFGVAMIYSAGQVHVPIPVTADAWVRQSLWLVIALAAFTAMSRVPLRWIEWAAVPFYVVAVVLLALTLVIGEGRGTAAGVKSRIDLGFISFQPAEIAKLATILALAHMLSQRDSALTSLREQIGRAHV